MLLDALIVLQDQQVVPLRNCCWHHITHQTSHNSCFMTCQTTNPPNEIHCYAKIVGVKDFNDEE